MNVLSSVGNAGGGSEDTVGFCGGFELCEVGVGGLRMRTDKLIDKSSAPTTDIAGAVGSAEVAGFYSWFGDWVQATLDREFGKAGSGAEKNIGAGGIGAVICYEDASAVDIKLQWRLKTDSESTEGTDGTNWVRLALDSNGESGGAVVTEIGDAVKVVMQDRKRVQWEGE
jgi:hypothetical protein